MKKVFFFLFSVFIFFQAVGQITYEATYQHYTYDYPVLKYFNHTSPKWLMVSGSTIYLYNLDHSLYRQFPNYCGVSGAQYLSDDLFDTDSSNFEYVCHTGNTMKIYREDGTLLFSRDTAQLGGFAPMIDADFQQSIFPTDSGTKMRVFINHGGYTHSDIYSLPGTLPCPRT